MYFPDEYKPREFITTRVALQDILKGVKQMITNLMKTHKYTKFTSTDTQKNQRIKLQHDGKLPNCKNK
jgi:hypothetical protein